MNRTNQKQPLRSNAIRRDRFELLEDRRLLAAIVAVFPSPNQLVQIEDASIFVGFDEPIDPMTVSPSTLAVHATETPIDFPTPPDFHGTAFSQALHALHPGELVEVTASQGIKTTAGDSIDSPFVWQFRAGVRNGKGVFESGVPIGGEDS